MNAPAPPVLPKAWLETALDPARSLGPPAVCGRLRCQPEDFIVEEQLGFEADGGSAHVLLRVEKTDANTLYVARALARQAGVRAADVGFAGLKDRRAVAVQWFSVPAQRTERGWAAFSGPGFRVLEALAHSRKLRRGALAGNRFRIRVRELTGNPASVAPRLDAIGSNGVPNYFGPQRFGRDATNLVAVASWTEGARLPRDRDERGFLFSAARSLAFNGVLAARVAAGSWNQLLDGEVVNLAGSGSVFHAEVIDDTLRGRCAALDVHPSGPLPGVNGLRPTRAAADIEQVGLAPFAAVAARLEQAGVEASRRALRVPVQDLGWALEGDELRVAFGLPRGAFATTVLREVVDFGQEILPAGED